MHINRFGIKKLSKILIVNFKNKYRVIRRVRFLTFNVIHPPVLLYQMGKVGSSTVYRSLKASGIKNPIYQVHHLSNDLDVQKKAHRKIGRNPYHLELSRALQKRISLKNKFKFKIITLVREPISREISNFFENPLFVSSDINDAHGNIDPIKAVDYLDRLFRDPHAFDYMFNWFDRELKTVFGIDVFSNKFDPELGYLRIEGEHADALIIRLEDLSDKGFKIISDFLSLPFPLAPLQANVRNQSEHSESYKVVKKKIKLDPVVCERIYESRFVRYFYSHNEISKFIQQWTE